VWFLINAIQAAPAERVDEFQQCHPHDSDRLKQRSHGEFREYRVAIEAPEVEETRRQNEQQDKATSARTCDICGCRAAMSISQTQDVISDTLGAPDA
jgi:hypothetical protein